MLVHTHAHTHTHKHTHAHTFNRLILLQPAKVSARRSEPILVRRVDSNIKVNLESILMKKLNMQGESGSQPRRDGPEPGKVSADVKSNLAALLGNKLTQPPPGVARAGSQPGASCV